MSVTIYVEGGGPSKARNTAAKCRQGFHQFLDKLLPNKKKPRIVASGSRDETYGDFRAALSKGNDSFILLLVDSEEPVRPGSTSWEHLAKWWIRPADTEEDQAHLMVQCMESWFLADKETLVAYFGQGFEAGGLPKNPQIEAIPKSDILASLIHASRNTKKKRYSKGSHAFEILALVDSAKVCAASRFAAQLRDCLLEKL